MICTDILAAASVPADHPAVAYLAEGFVAVMNLVQPEGMPT